VVNRVDCLTGAWRLLASLPGLHPVGRPRLGATGAQRGRHYL